MTQTGRPAGAWENWFADVLYTYRPAGATEEQYVSVPRVFHMRKRNRLDTY